MLILPLHRRWTRKNFPWLTLLLVLANVFVFAVLQSGDTAIYRQAQAYYFDSELPALEFPAYLDWRQRHAPTSAPAAATPGIASSPERLAQIESDGAFLADLHADRVITPANPRHAAWQEQRARFDAILDRAFTRAHALRFSRFEPGRLLSAMFLHGGVDHLLGNMIFLLVVGMLVEGALGHGPFLALYLLGGMIAGLASLGWHWGSDGNSVGASGAIAALMGAYAVIWGRRKVRVFYWAFVVFDYVKVPALLVLGFWFAWLVVYPWLDTGSRVDYADHAGGLTAGMAMAFVLARFGRVRRAFVEEDERVERQVRDDDDFAQAQQLLGQLDIDQARAILLRLDQAQPNQWRVQLALYRCARYHGSIATVDAAAARAFALAATADARELASVCDDYLKACGNAPRLPRALLLGVLPALQDAGDDESCERLLRCQIAATPGDDELATAWFQLALRSPEGSAARRERLQFLLQQFPGDRHAGKARFLLDQG